MPVKDMELGMVGDQPWVQGFTEQEAGISPDEIGADVSRLFESFREAGRRHSPMRHCASEVVKNNPDRQSLRASTQQVSAMNADIVVVKNIDLTVYGVARPAKFPLKGRKKFTASKMVLEFPVDPDRQACLIEVNLKFRRSRARGLCAPLLSRPCYGQATLEEGRAAPPGESHPEMKSSDGVADNGTNGRPERGFEQGALHREILGLSSGSLCSHSSQS